MKIIPASLACLLSASLIFAPVAGAQDIHSVFGNRQANTTDDLQKSITMYSYTWEIPGSKAAVKFNTDGTGKQSFFSFTWSVKNPQQIELAMAGSTTKAEIIFGTDYTSYIGIGFDGASIHGSLVMPPAPAKSTPPPVAAATPPPLPTVPPSTNPFFDNLSHTMDAPSTNSDDLVKAIVGTEYTWNVSGYSGVTVKFEADGKAQSNLYKRLAWKVRSAHEIEITVPGNKDIGRMVMRFNTDFSKYTGTDFYGDDVQGSKAN